MKTDPLVGAIARWGRWAQWSFPLLSAPFRRHAVAALARNLGHCDALRQLVHALRAPSADVRERTESVLRALSNAPAIDALCAAWNSTRDGHLAAIVAQCGYVASQPAELRVLSAIYVGRLDDLRTEAGASMPALIAALQDCDPKIAAATESVLRSLAQSGRDALIDFALLDADDPSRERAIAIVEQCGYRHSDDGRWFLHLAATGRFEQYLAEDFEFQRLRAEFRAAPAPLQHRIRAAITRTGDPRMAGLFAAGCHTRTREAITAEDAELLTHICERNRQWPELFQWLRWFPGAQLGPAVKALAASGWQPAEEADAALFAKLTTIAGELGVNVNATVLLAGDNPVLRRWLSSGPNGSPELLRARLTEGTPPPEQIAALGALHKAGVLTVDDLARAISSPHWLVRLAALALGAPANSEEPVHWVRVAFDARAAQALKPWQVRSLEDVAALQNGLKRLSDRRAAGPLLFIEAIRAHEIAGDFSIEEGVRVTLSDDAFSIEG